MTADNDAPGTSLPVVSGCNCDWEFHGDEPCSGPVAEGTDKCWQCIVVCCAEAEEARNER